MPEQKVAVAVLHKMDTDFDPFTDGDYELVAIVAVRKDNALDEAFHLTNHIDWSWQQNPEILQWWPDRNSDFRGNRSTSVGDIVIVDNATLYVVNSIGFIEYERRS